MKKSTILLGLMAVALSAVAQESNKFSFELAKLSSYELTMTEYEQDTTADAIVIYESGDFYFDFVNRQEKNDFYFSLVKDGRFNSQSYKKSFLLVF